MKVCLCCNPFRTNIVAVMLRNQIILLVVVIISTYDRYGAAPELERNREEEGIKRA